MTGLSKQDCQPKIGCCLCLLQFFCIHIFDTTFMNISCIYNEKMPVCFCKKNNLYLKKINKYGKLHSSLMLKNRSAAFV